MFYIAAKYLAGTVQQEQIDEGCLYPPLEQIRIVSSGIALAVASHVFEKGYTKMTKPENLEKHINDSMYVPNYDFVCKI
jgi:malate dehydrogenase (oxaloacetate-decarboxylating)(NADP+)